MKSLSIICIKKFLAVRSLLVIILSNNFFQVLYGGEVPKKYYFTNEDIAADMLKINIPRGSMKTIPFDINLHNCQLV